MRKLRWCLAVIVSLGAGTHAGVAAAQQVTSGEVVYEGPYNAGMTNSQFAPATDEAVNAGVVGPYSPWHYGYHHVAWGQPVALVVPPTATHQTNWGWGIGNTRVTAINPQFMGPMNAAPSQYQYGRTQPTPYYVSDTLQFGVYYIRGPW